MNEYESLRQGDWLGFAHVYLNHCKKDLKSDDEIDIKVYSQLVELDTKLGTKASEHLSVCLLLTTRSDIIKVCSAGSTQNELSIQKIEKDLINIHKNTFLVTFILLSALSP